LRGWAIFATMSGMRTVHTDTHQAGFVNVLVMGLVVVTILFVGAVSFGIWAFMSRQDYKTNSDQKSAVAASQAKKDTQAADALQNAEAAKNPLKTYVGPSQYGSVNIQYPKTWSAYVVEQDSTSSTPSDYYFHPDTVPNVDNNENAYSLRVQVNQQTYDKVLASYDGLVKANKVRVTPYSLSKVPSVIGSRIDGQITAQKQGSIILLPLRNVTLEVWTEANQFLPDFNTIILQNVSFSP